MESFFSIWEKPLTRAPRKPSSFTQRVSSRAASSGSCIASAARPWKRCGRFCTSAARKSLARRAMAVARAGSGIAWTAGALSESSMSSMPFSSICLSRYSWRSSSRFSSSGHTASPRNPFESLSVSGIAKCSSSPILPCMRRLREVGAVSRAFFPQVGACYPLPEPVHHAGAGSRRDQRDEGAEHHAEAEAHAYRGPGVLVHRPVGVGRRLARTIRGSGHVLLHRRPHVAHPLLGRGRDFLRAARRRQLGPFHGFPFVVVTPGGSKPRGRKIGVRARKKIGVRARFP